MNASARRVEEYFAALGSAVQQAWLALDHDDERFAAVAVAALEAQPPAENLSYRDVIHWLAVVEDLPWQAKLDEAFGQPPITLFWNGRFQIEVLFWHTATTAIHQHAFSGAFAVLGGSSVHCRYEFEVERRVNARFAVGAARLTEVEWLEIGAIRPIAPAAGLIHSLFHLETPSVTVVVRTCGDLHTGPELVYYVPTVALDPSHDDALRVKRLQMVDLLVRMRADDLEAVVWEIASHCDLHTTFLLLVKLATTPRCALLYERLLARARERHGEVVDTFVPAIEEEQRRRRVVDLRRSVLDPDHRFFLALLLNLPDRAAIDRLVRSRFAAEAGDPVAPIDRIESWILEIAAAGGLGLSFDPSLRHLLRACLEGADIEAILQALRETHGAESINAQEEAIREACRRLEGHPVLKPLFVFQGQQDLNGAS